MKAGKALNADSDGPPQGPVQGPLPVKPLTIAIVGAGPSGFYLAAALLELGLDCEIDFIEALPTPFGLIRGGVAPDHQKTKQV
ncbi:MAG TPA: NAD(P)-binding protein, partial [Kiloniellales bacterium]|nr:NAD(P)-binding protein [Kiloniellales bacterium]